MSNKMSVGKLIVALFGLYFIVMIITTSVFTFSPNGLWHNHSPFGQYDGDRVGYWAFATFFIGLLAVPAAFVGGVALLGLAGWSIYYLVNGVVHLVKGLISDVSTKQNNKNADIELRSITSSTFTKASKNTGCTESTDHSKSQQCGSV
ncbi:hypothetical protein BT63DRAFT_436844 [Microthyrium microscopicum]|uniref:Uncharacterized protein n=1 Tax=Microthyrium microscopicum TaxID=703497 RepID=A0A6A6UMX5_9PEZI|nr:hypothetical protein BT63DRAFT_436844 [Microthyrium microscopicum]